ncbi:MAG: hypothetical protein LBK56_13970 [Gracilibacteraceae bacterium]|nr:hypothetical protein [Gracilibacteraceae bacterium]
MKGDSDKIASEKLIQTLHKEETGIKGLDFETGIIISRNGDVVHREKGRKNSVTPPRELIKDNIFTHNHPSGGCAFSVGDIKSIIADDGDEVRVVTRDGRFVSLKKDSGELNTNLGEDMGKAGLVGARLMLAGDSICMKKYGRGNYGNQHVIKECEQIVNNWLRENAEKYGYVFTEGTI